MPDVNHEQVMFVTTLPERPTFLVHEFASNSFIAGLVTDGYGMQADGAPHEWSAFSRADVEEAIRAQRAAADQVKAEQVLGKAA